MLLTDRSHLLIVVFAALLCMACVPSARAQLLPPDPTQPWREIETEHFTVHHVAGSESLAQRLAGIAEATHAFFLQEYGLAPGGHVEVYLQESYDIVNSATSVPLHRSVFIFPDPPYGLPEGNFAHARDWLTLAFAHEYTHAVDLDQRKDLWELVHIVTGFGYPNLFRPLWLTEGLAVWAESQATGAGRIGSPTAEMLIRTDVLEGRLREPWEWSGAPERWPGGSFPYIYGGTFMEFLSEGRNPNAPVDYSIGTSGGFPWNYRGSAAVATRGKPFDLVLIEFLEQEQAKADETVAWIAGQSPLREGRPVCRPGSSVSDIEAARAGHIVYVAHDSDYEDPSIAEVDAETGRVRAIVTTSSSDVTISEGIDGVVVYSDLDVIGGSYLQSQLFSVDPIDSKGTRVSSEGRLREPAVWPTDPGLILACRRKGGRSRLVRAYGTEAREIQTDLPKGADAFSPSWSPDGSRFAVSVRLVSGRQDIWIVDWPSGRSRPLTDDEDCDLSPSFSSDGRYVFFSSDRTGVWDIYAADVEERRLFQVTNVTSGAFLPSPSADGRSLYFVRYSPEGDEVRRIEVDPGTWVEMPPGPPERLPVHEAYLSRIRETDAGERVSVADFALSRPPRPVERHWAHRLRFLNPIVRIPLPIADEDGIGIGVLCAGGDPLTRQSYTCLVGVGAESGRMSYSAIYRLYLLGSLMLDVEAVDLASSTSADVTDANDYPWRRDLEQDVSIAWQRLELRQLLELRAGINTERTTAVAPGDTSLAELPDPDFFTGRTTECYGSVYFSNAHRSPLSFSPEDGISAMAKTGVRIKVLGGERTGTVQEVDLRAYRRFGKNFVAALRGTWMGSSEGDLEFGSGGDLSITAADSLFMTSSAATGAAELRFRLAEIQKPVLGDWFFADRLHGAAFYELAHYRPHTEDAVDDWEQAWSAGVRVSADVTVGYMFKTTLDLVGAYSSLGGTALVFGAGLAF